MKCTIKWHKLNEKAIIPTKRIEDAGFDIYTIEDGVTLAPQEKHLFSTGICYDISSGFYLLGFDRGSTGSKGLHLHCGVCDQGYRGEVFVCICNDNAFPAVFTSEVSKVEMRDGKLYYPTSKAIAQLIPMQMPLIESIEVGDDEWEKLKNNSERGEGKLGNSGK